MNIRLVRRKGREEFTRNDENTFVTRSLKNNDVRKCITCYTYVWYSFLRRLSRGQFVLGRNLSQLQVHTDNEATFDGSLSRLIVAIAGLRCSIFIISNRDQRKTRFFARSSPRSLRESSPHNDVRLCCGWCSFATFLHCVQTNVLTWPDHAACMQNETE